MALRQEGNVIDPDAGAIALRQEGNVRSCRMRSSRCFRIRNKHYPPDGGRPRSVTTIIALLTEGRRLARL